VDNYDGQALVEGYDPPLVLTVTITNIAAARKGWHGGVKAGDLDRLTDADVKLTLLSDSHKGWKSVAGIVWGEGKNGIVAAFIGRSGWDRPRS
jgi:hypothetical protein